MQLLGTDNKDLVRIAIAFNDDFGKGKRTRLRNVGRQRDLGNCPTVANGNAATLYAGPVYFGRLVDERDQQGQQLSQFMPLRMGKIAQGGIVGECGEFVAHELVLR